MRGAWGDCWAQMRGLIRAGGGAVVLLLHHEATGAPKGPCWPCWPPSDEEGREGGRGGEGVRRAPVHPRSVPQPPLPRAVPLSVPHRTPSRMQHSAIRSPTTQVSLKTSTMTSWRRSTQCTGAAPAWMDVVWKPPPPPSDRLIGKALNDWLLSQLHLLSVDICWSNSETLHREETGYVRGW